MWYRLGQNILNYKKTYLFFVFILTVVMGYFAAQIKLSYEYTKAIPSDNPKFVVYNDFVKKYGVDGTTVVIGFKSNQFYTKAIFNQVDRLHKKLKQNSAVAEVMSISTAYTIEKDSIETKFNARKIFHAPYTSDSILIADQMVFENLPFYKNLYYNPDSNSYIMAIAFKADSINSGSRTKIIAGIQNDLDQFSQAIKTEVHVSGLPFIRTIMADRIKKEMFWFLIGSLVLSAITLLLFFRSISAMIMSLAVVLMGVIWSLGSMVLLGQKITLLTALIPPLIVVIGIPNCIYFLNKYHTTFKDTLDKEKAIVQMVGRMGVVTLFCNITAAIGFFVLCIKYYVLIIVVLTDKRSRLH